MSLTDIKIRLLDTRVLGLTLRLLSALVKANTWPEAGVETAGVETAKQVLRQVFMQVLRHRTSNEATSNG